MEKTKFDSQTHDLTVNQFSVSEAVFKIISENLSDNSNALNMMGIVIMKTNIKLKTSAPVPHKTMWVKLLLLSKLFKIYKFVYFDVAHQKEHFAAPLNKIDFTFTASFETRLYTALP